MRATGAPETLRRGQARHAKSGLDSRQWNEFLLIYKGDVDKSLAAYVAWADREIAALSGVAPPPGAPNASLIADDADLLEFPLAPITAEVSRLGTLAAPDLPPTAVRYEREQPHELESA